MATEAEKTAELPGVEPRATGLTLPVLQKL